MAAGLFVAGTITIAAQEISGLQVEQPISVKDQLYSVTPALHISFTLQSPADVTVEIKRHLAGYQQFHWPWLPEPYLVRTLALGQQTAGPHSIDWDGLDDKGQPITETHNLVPPDYASIAKKTKAEDFVVTVPVNFLQVVVKTGQEELKANFERGDGILEPNRTAINFRGSAVDKDGHYILANFTTWSAYRYTPDFVAEADKIFPQSGLDPGRQPAECSMAAVDSRNRVLIGCSAGIFLYEATGHGIPWTHQAAYIRDNVLGLKTDDTSKIGQPGMAHRFLSFTVDDKDNIYLEGETPVPHLEVFSPDGAFLRSLPLPANTNFGMIAWAGNNTLAVGVNSSLLLLDSQSGTIKKTVKDCPAYFVRCDRAGNIYAGPQATDLHRYTPAGDPLPFNSTGLNVHGNRLFLDLVNANSSLPSGHVPFPAGAAGIAPGQVLGLAFAADGSFYASEDGAAPTGLLHYSKDGAFLPDNLTIKWGCQKLGNVYLDDEPATMQLLVTNFTDKQQPLTVKWTLTDFDGKQTSGSSEVAANPLARQVLPFTLTMPEMGHYQLTAKVSQGGAFIEELHAQLARIPSRPIFEDRYSSFAIVWMGEWELMSLIGAKSTRGDYLNWQSIIEPVEGVFLPEHPAVPEYSFGGPETLRAYTRKYGIFNTNMLDYGEPWLGGYGGQISSYDRFYEYSLHCIDLYAGKGEAFFQFWNEPNFYWRYASPYPFAREEFGLVQAHVWSMVKARDKNITSLADGDAGGIQINQEFADWNLGGYIDTLEMHYPGSTPLAFNNMPMPDIPETKADAIAKLVDLRDRLFPGKQVFNTEESIPANPMTAEMTATNLPRVDIPQLAVGVAKVFQFSQTGIGATRHDVTCFLDENGEPFPTYVTYATMTRMIDGAVFITKPDLGPPGTYAYLFARPHDFVLVANSIAGNIDVSLDVGVPRVVVVDLVGRSHTISTDSGKLKLTLSPRVQYVVLPRDSSAKAMASDELKKELNTFQVDNPRDISDEITATLKSTPVSLTGLNRLYHLVQAAEVAEAAGEAPPDGMNEDAKTARHKVEEQEGPDGYLRQSRVALDFAEHLAQIARHDPTMSWPATLAAQMTESLAASETPCYPGAVVNAYIGDIGEIEKIRATVQVANKPETAIDNQFRFQIDHKPGDCFELELSVYDYFSHNLSGTVTPRLPDGWQASPASAAYSLTPGKMQRFMFTVTIPADAKPGVNPIGGQTTYNNAVVQELHPMRIKL